MNLSLSELQKNRLGRVTVVSPDSSGTFSRLGLIPGTEVRCLRLCPLGGPGVYLVRGAVYAIRRADAAGIHVELVGSDRCEMFREKGREAE